MTPEPVSASHACRRRSGFTLIELLVVIGIILVLIGILLPVVGQVRVAARKAATQQEMNKIGSAIQQYYLEYGAYPGPFSDNDIMKGKSTVDGNGITMTENMVLGLCGGLEFSGPTTITYKSSSLQSALGPMNLNANPAKQTRHAAFIDSTPGERMPPLPWDNANGKQADYDSYVPEFLDKFTAYAGGLPRPIIYIRAIVNNPLNSGSASAPVICEADATSDNKTQYSWNQVISYAVAGNGDFYGFPGAPGGTVDAADAQIGNAANPSYRSSAAPYYVNANGTTNLWSAYLGNPNQPNSPRGANAFMLISAGGDGIYGTTDDIFYP